MIRKFHIVLCLALVGCSRHVDPAPSPPISALVVGGVYAVPSYIPDDPYWCMWKVLAEQRGDVWYMFFTNRIPASQHYSTPPELGLAGTLSQSGTNTNWGASFMPKEKFLSTPVLWYIGQTAVTSFESNALRVSMRSYYETRDRIIDRMITRTNR